MQLPPRLILCLVLILPAGVRAAAAPVQPVTVSVDGTTASAAIAPRFLGLSYEMSMVLPMEGRYYFSPDNQPLINTFHTLGIKSLRVGANAVDDPRIPVPQEKDIDSLFAFARAAGVKVIYSFRLKNGNPAEAARLAAYIAAHYGDLLDAFSIGNEPGYYHPFDVYFAKWKPIYDAILQKVPNAVFDGPSPGPSDYILKLVDAIYPTGHLSMASDHYYFLGSGRAGEKDPAATRARFLSDSIHHSYERAWKAVGAKLADQGVPFRIDELNSCFNGGSRDSSDTYASTLWALDCTHWWAAHHILGMNYHTGESVGRDGGFSAANYAAFVYTPDHRGYRMRPQAYAYLAFQEGAQGQALPVQLQSAAGFNFDAYAYRDGGVLYLTLINKSYGATGASAAVSINLPAGATAGSFQEMPLVQQNADVAAKDGVTLGGQAVDSTGTWTGNWTAAGQANLLASPITVPPASALLLRVNP